MNMRDATTETIEKEQANFRMGLLFAITGTALFGLKSIFIKLAFAEGVDAPTLLSLRMLMVNGEFLGRNLQQLTYFKFLS